MEVSVEIFKILLHIFRKFNGPYPDTVTWDGEVFILGIR